MKQTLFIVLSVIIVTTILTTNIVRQCQEEKEYAVMRNDVDNMCSQVERYNDILDDYSDMACEIYEDFNTSANMFYRQTNADSARVYYHNVCECYKIVDKYATDNIKVELSFSNVLQKKRQTDR